MQITGFKPEISRLADTRISALSHREFLKSIVRSKILEQDLVCLKSAKAEV